MISNYKELKFWQTAYSVTLEIVKLSRKIPRDRVADIILNQVIRSSSSVGANIAEGFGRYKSKEYKRHLQIALGSANETEYWLTILKDAFQAYNKDIDQIVAKNLETIKMLAASLKTISNKNKD